MNQDYPKRATQLSGLTWPDCIARLATASRVRADDVMWHRWRWEQYPSNILHDVSLMGLVEES